MEVERQGKKSEKNNIWISGACAHYAAILEGSYFQVIESFAGCDEWGG